MRVSFRTSFQRIELCPIQGNWKNKNSKHTDTGENIDVKPLTHRHSLNGAQEKRQRERKKLHSVSLMLNFIVMTMDYYPLQALQIRSVALGADNNARLWKWMWIDSSEWRVANRSANTRKNNNTKQQHRFRMDLIIFNFIFSIRNFLILTILWVFVLFLILLVFFSYSVSIEPFLIACY